ncbi:MAG: hypothetical protein ACKV1O_19580 [Saprospiraceae bacterium]
MSGIEKLIFAAPIQSTDLSFSGGTDRTKFYFSGSYFNQDGIIIGSNFDRMSVRINLDNLVTDKFKIGTSTSFSNSNSTRLNNDNNIFGVLSTAVLLGTHIPVFYGFDLSFFFQFNYGNKIYNNTKAFAEGMNSVFGQIATVRDRWTPENTDTDIPRAVWADPNNNRRVSDRFLEDGSYLRLKNVTLGYNLPSSLLQQLRLSKLRLYVSGQNLLTFTDYSGFDPEVSTFGETNTAPGTDFLTFPQSRTILFGLNVAF